MSDRNAFLTRVRQAAAQGRQYRVQSRSIPDEIGYLGAGDDLVERFATEVNAVGVTNALGDGSASRTKSIQILVAGENQSIQTQEGESR